MLYIWITNNLERRLYEHKNKLIEWFTSKYNINKLIYYEECSDVNIAINREKQLKWRSRIKKDKLITSINPKRENLFFV
jgi:putative endonuclease